MEYWGGESKEGLKSRPNRQSLAIRQSQLKLPKIGVDGTRYGNNSENIAGFACGSNESKFWQGGQCLGGCRDPGDQHLGGHFLVYVSDVDVDGIFEATEWNVDAEFLCGRGIEFTGGGIDGDVHRDGFGFAELPSVQDDGIGVEVRRGHYDVAGTGVRSGFGGDDVSGSGWQCDGSGDRYDAGDRADRRVGCDGSQSDPLLGGTSIFGLCVVDTGIDDHGRLHGDCRRVLFQCDRFWDRPCAVLKEQPGLCRGF